MISYFLFVVIVCDKLSLVITTVEINESIQKELDQDIKQGLLKKEVRELIAFWRVELTEVGYNEYLISPLAKMLRDHPLKESRQGERSIELNETGGRLGYRYYKNKIIVKVIKITPDHNYE